jgi:translation elongation factor EF-4
MHGTINFKSPNNTKKWQMGFNYAFKGLLKLEIFVDRLSKTNHLPNLMKNCSVAS